MWGAVLNISLHRTLTHADTAIDSLLDPTVRRAMVSTEQVQLVQTVADALHNVFVGATFFAVAAVIVVGLLPGGVSPTRPAKRS